MQLHRARMLTRWLHPKPPSNLTAEQLGAWRGLLRVHTALVKALDAELTAAHDLPLSSYEVLITLESAPGHKRRMAELADSVLLSRSGHDAARGPAGARRPARPRHLHRRRSRLLRRAHRQGRASCSRERGRRISMACASASSSHFSGTSCACSPTPGSACCRGPPRPTDGRRPRAHPRDRVRAVQPPRHACRRRGPDHRRGRHGEDDAVPQLRVQGRADRGVPRRARAALDARLAAGRGASARATDAARRGCWRSSTCSASGSRCRTSRAARSST